MTPPGSVSIEDRLRHAYDDAAATIRPEDVATGLPPPRLAKGGGTRRRRLLRLAIPLAAAAAVLAVAVGVMVTPAARPRPPAVPPAQPDSGSPRFVVTVPATNFWLDVHNAVTGVLTARIRTPMDYLKGGYFYSVAAQRARTFVVGEVVGSDTYLYRLVLTGSGTVRSMTRLGTPVPGVVLMSSVTPGGRSLGYLTLTTTAGSRAHLTLVIRDLVTSRTIASWPLTSVWDVVTSLSVDASGTAMSVTSYHFTHAEIRGRRYNYDLVQATRVLYPDTSGTPLERLPVFLHQGGAAALSPDGRTLYQVVQENLTDRSWLSSRPAVFQVSAIDVSNGTTTAVLHTFHRVWRTFHPLMALDPSGRWLLILDGTAASRISVPAGRYAGLGQIRPAVPPVSYNQSSVIGPVAW